MRTLLLALALCLTSSASSQTGLDPAFGDDGVALIFGTSVPALSSFNTKLAVQRSGRIVASAAVLDNGMRTISPAVFAVTPDGAPDLTFGDGGRRDIDLPDNTFGIALDAQDRVYVALLAFLDPGTARLAARLTADGALDTSYGTDGAVTISIPDSLDYLIAKGITVDAAGRTVVPVEYEVANTGARIGAVRLLPDGTPDMSFGDGGLVLVPLLDGSLQDKVFEVATLSDGSIILVGSKFKADNVTRVLIYKLTPDGTPDAAFGEGGAFSLESPRGSFSGVTVLDDGSILAYGSTRDDDTGEIGTATAAKVTAAGQLDLGFGDAGVAAVFGGVEGEQPLYLKAIVDGDGFVLVGRKRQLDPFLFQVLVSRITADGLPDATFGNDGSVVIMTGNEEFESIEISDALLLPDGRIAIGGTRDAVDNDEYTQDACIAALLPLGTVSGEAGPTGESGLALSLLANPSKAPTVRLAATSTSDVTVMAYDALGREVARLHQGALTAGEHSWTLPAGLAPGVYVVRASGVGGVAARTFTVVR